MTEQERNTPVTFRDIEILLQELAKVQGEVFAKTDKRIVEAIEETLDAIIDRLRRITYHQTRMEYFVLACLVDLFRSDIVTIKAKYKRWCEEFDAQNGHLLDISSPEGEEDNND